jgi:hypothetical protein
MTPLSYKNFVRERSPGSAKALFKGTSQQLKLVNYIR